MYRYLLYICRVNNITDMNANAETTLPIPNAKKTVKLSLQTWASAIYETKKLTVQYFKNEGKTLFNNN